MPSPAFSHRAGFRPSAVRRGGRAGAFTLVELLVTMVVGTLLIVFLFQLFSASMRAWRQGEDQAETFREARAALQLMVRDLSQTVGPMTGSVYASATPTPPAIPTPMLVVAPSLVIDKYPDPSRAQPGDGINEEVYCLTTIPNDGVSQLCAVGYFCGWTPAYNTGAARPPKAYSLMRQYLGSGSSTVPGLFDRFKAHTGSSPLTFYDVFDRTTTPKPSVTALAAYVWDLQIRTSSTLLPATAPTTSDYPLQPASTGWPSALPTYVEIRFKALSESAVRQLEGNPSVDSNTWNDANAATNPIYKNIILPGTRQFSARVPIYSGTVNATPPP